jgi:transcriptional regulator with XRE-family HTH domain
MANGTAVTLGEVIRDARVGLGISLRDLAKRVELAPSYLSDIENDRRVPSEEVLQRLADEVKLKFDDLMALAGRVGDQTERYMKRHPAAGLLFRKISDKRLRDEDLESLLKTVETMGSKKRGP